MKEGDKDEDGTSITNKPSVGRIKSMFEPAMQGPKPTLPSKPFTKPTPPKRSDDTKPTSNGDVTFPPKNNFLPRKNLTEISSNNKDENSNIESEADVKLNPQFVSKFNKLNSNENNDQLKSKPPWMKSNQSDIGVKPIENKTKPPLEGLAGRMKMFEQKNDDLCDKNENKPQLNEHLPKLSEAKAAISEKFHPKLPTPMTKDFKPSPIGIKPTNHQNESAGDTKPINSNSIKTQESEKPGLHAKPRIPSSSSPLIPISSQSSELLLKLQKRKESMKKVSGVNDEQPQLRPGTRTKSVKRKSLTRVTDNKKFYLVEISNTDNANEPPPRKPAKIDVEDFDKIVTDHKNKFLSQNEKERPVSQGVVEEVEDIYEELPGGDEDVDFPPPPSLDNFPRPVSARPVSVIQPMTEEDELDVDDIYDEGISTTTNETSPPGIPGRPPRRGNLPDEPFPEPPATLGQGIDSVEASGGEPEVDELYEPLDEIANEVTAKIEEQNSSASLNDSKSEQLSEKERKKREKEEKKRLEQEKKNQEKRLKELKKYKIDPNELEPQNSKGSGTVKEDSKGKGKDLPVKKGQRVVIICMDNRVPKGKWMVKLSDGEDIGFVDSNNVEVMEGSFMQKTSIDSITEDQEEYEAVEPEQDDVYSEAA